MLFALIAAPTLGFSAEQLLQPWQRQLPYPWLILRLVDVDGIAIKRRPVDYVVFHEKNLARGAIGDGTDESGRILIYGFQFRPATYEFAGLIPGAGYAPLQKVTVKRGAKEVFQDIEVKPGGILSGRILERGTHQPVGGEIIHPWRTIDQESDDGNTEAGPVFPSLISG